VGVDVADLLAAGGRPTDREAASPPAPRASGAGRRDVMGVGRGSVSPTTSATICAPRLRGAPTTSRITTAAPSPITKQSRVRSYMKALSERNDDPKDRERPFDRDRDGFVMGDGAAVVILEGVGARRGAGREDRRRGGGLRATPTPITSRRRHPTARGRRRRMADAVGRPPARARSPHQRPRHVDPHGSGRDGSREGRVRRSRRKLIFGSTKSMTGHLLGAAGAFELAICALALKNSLIRRTINQFNPDPACDLDSAPNHAVNASSTSRYPIVRVRGAQRDAGGKESRVTLDLSPTKSNVASGSRARMARAFCICRFVDDRRSAISPTGGKKRRPRLLSANQHINPTNVCILRNTCVFCSFARMPREDGAYTRRAWRKCSAKRMRRGIIRRVNFISSAPASQATARVLRGDVPRLKERLPQVMIKALTAARWPISRE